MPQRARCVSSSNHHSRGAPHACARQSERGRCARATEILQPINDWTERSIEGLFTPLRIRSLHQLCQLLHFGRLRVAYDKESQLMRRPSRDVERQLLNGIRSRKRTRQLSGILQNQHRYNWAFRLLFFKPQFPSLSISVYFFLFLSQFSG